MAVKIKSFFTLMVASWALLLLSSCDSLSVFVPPTTVPSLDKISSIGLNEQGQLAVSWQAKPNSPASTYQVYLLELPVDDTQYAFTSAALNADPLKVEEIEIAPEEAPRKKGELVNSGRDLDFVFSELLDPGRRYLVQIAEKGRRIKAGAQKVQLVEIQFEPFAATSATVVDDYVRLNWEPVSGANRYEVYADKEMTVLLTSTRAAQADIHTENGEFPKEFYVRAFRGLLGAPEPVLIAFNQSKVSVIKVESTKPDGTYTIGEKLDFHVTFSDKVNVYGSSFLPLIFGDQSREAKYAAGNGTANYLYTYTVQAGDDTELLANGKLLSGEFVDSASLSVSGVLPEAGKNLTVAELNAIAIDTIEPTPPMSVGFNTSASNTGDFSVSWGASQDKYFKQHNLKLCSNAACSASCNAPQAVTGTTQSFTAITAGIFYACVQGEDTTGLTSDWISSLNPVVIDATAPQIARVYASSADGIYKETQNVIISVEFNENVDVNVGSQVTLKLETGGTDREALYTAGSGTSRLDFTYTVQAGDTSADLNYHSINALSIGTGNIKDFAGNPANLVLPGTSSPNSLASQSSVVIDTTAPSSPNTVTFPAANSATTSVIMSWNASTDSNFKQHNAKLCLANDCSTSCTSVTSSATSPVTLNGLDGNSYYGCVQGEDLPGHLSPWAVSAATVRIDTSVPTVLNVTSATPNGSYKEGQTLDLLVQFSEAVNVTGGGSIQLQLETGSSDGSASYLSGSGTDTLTFRYTIQAGDATPDLNYVSTTALTLSGGTIKDLTNNDADLVLPALAGPNSLGSRQAIAIDTEAPTAPTNVAFPASTTSSTTLGFTWDASTDPHFAHYNTKLCSAADCSTACSSVTTAGTTSGAGSGVDGSSYYACVQAEDSLGHTSAWIASTAAVAVDNTAPTVIKVNSSSADGIYKTDDTLGFSVQFSESVLITNGTDLSLMLETGATDHAATYVSGNGSDTLVFTYTVQAGDTAADLDAQSIGALSKGASGTIKDAAGNDAALTLPALGGANSIAGQKAIILDTTAPSAPSAVGFAGSMTNSLTFDMSWSNSNDTNFLRHNVKICTNSDCASGCETTLTSLASPRTMTGVNGSTYYGCVQGEDGAGLTSSWVNSLATITVDATQPTVLSVHSSKANGAYKTGELIDIAIVFSETVVVASPSELKLLLETGATSREAIYQSGSNSSTLVFRYKVQAGDASSDLNYKTPNALSVGAGSIQDLAGSNAILALPALADANSLASQKDLVIDTTAPAAPVITSPADASYQTSAVTVVSGTSETNATIELKSGSTVIGTTVASGTSWSITLASPLGDGSYILSATATDAATNVSPASADSSFTVHSSAPNPPVIATLTTPTSDQTPTISGTSEAGMTIKVYANGVEVATTTANGSGNWSVDTSTLTEDDYLITATATDAGARTSSASTDVPLNVDISAPSAPSNIVFPASPKSNSTTLAMTWNDSTDGNFSHHNVKICTASDCSTGCISDGTQLASPASMLGVDLGVYYGCVQGEDSLGHKSAWVVSAQTVEIDSTEASVSNVTSSITNGAYTTGASIDIVVTFTKPITVTNGQDLGLLLELGGTDRTASFVSSSGSSLTFNYAVQAGDTSADLEYQSTAALSKGSSGAIKDAVNTDANLTLPPLGGSSSLAGQKAIIIDTTVPSNPTSVGFASSTTTSTTFNMTWSNSTDTNFSTHNVKICTDSACSLDCTSASTANAGPKSMTGLDGSTYYGCVQGKDTAGLLSAWVSSLATITIDATAPTILNVTSSKADGSYKVGETINLLVQFSENVFVANDGDVKLRMETGTTDRIAPYTTGSGTDTLTFTYTVQAGDSSPDLDYQSTSALTITPSGSIKDVAGSAATLTLPALGSAASIAGQKAIVIDTSAPPAPVIVAPADESYSTTAITTVSGTSESGAQITLKSGSTTIGTTTASSTNWSITLSSALSDGVYSLTAIATDLAGNEGPASTANDVTVDTSAPNAPVVATLATPTSDSTPTISGTAEAGMTIKVYADATLIATTTADGSGNWSVDSNALTDATYSITATATDPGPRTSAASNAVPLNIDTTNPSAPAGIAFSAATSTSTSLSFSWTNSTDVNFQTHNIKICTDSACSIGCLGNTTANASPATLTGSNGASYYACVQGVDAVGHTSAWIASAATGTIDTTPPTVTSVSASTADGYYKSGDVIAVTVTFSEIVSVTTPAQLGLQLETGTSDRTAVYDSGTGSATLTFHYTVQAGDASADLNYLATSSLTKGSGAIKDIAGNDATLTLPDLASANSLATQKAIVIDTTAPSDPSSVGFAGSSTNSPTFNVSWSASTDANFSTHNVKLCTNTACSANCTTAITSATSPASVTGVDGTTYYGCIQGQDLAGLKSNWVNSASTILIDASAPTVVSVSSTQADGSYKAGVTIPITVQFSETVVVTNETDLYLILETGTTDRNAVYASGHNSNTLTFNYVVQAGDVSSDLNYVSPSSLKLGTAGTIKDLSGNAANLTLPDLANANSLGTQKAIVIDTAAPAAPVITTPANGAYSTTNVTTISGTSESGASITIIKGGSTIGTATASGTSWTVTLASALTDGSHTLTATAADAAGNVSTASAANTFTVDTSPPTAPVITTYTSPTNDTTPAVSGTSEAGMTINLFADGSAIGSTTADGSGNWSLSLNTLAQGTYTITAKATDPGSRVSAASTGVSMTIDTTPPTVSSVTSTSSDATYGPGNSIIIRVNFSENVYTTGTPQIQLEAGTSDPQASYISGSSGSSLYFTFTVATGHSTSDLDYVSTTALTGTIKDAAGNAATLTLPAPGAANSLGANKAIVLDGIAPTVTNITSTKADTMYGPNAVIDIQVTFSEPVFVLGGTPTLSLNTTPSRSASYASGSTTNTLTFNYTVQTNDVQADLNATALALNGATIRDAGSNNATLTVPASQATGSLNLNKNIQIAGDSVAPVLTVTPSSQNKFTGAAITSVNVDTTTGNDKDADNTAVTYTCRFDNTNNSAMDSGGTDCASLPSTAYSFSSSTGVLTWTPSAAASLSDSAPTVYEFRVVGTDPTLISGEIYFTVNVLKSFTKTVGFDAGDSGNYSYSSTSIDYSGGYARLLASDQIDDDNTSTGFGGSAYTDSGTAWLSNAQQLGDNAGCDGRVYNCQNSGNDWVTVSSNKVAAYPFDSDAGGWTAGNGTVVNSSTERKVGTGSIYLDGTQSHLYRAQQASNSFTYNFWIKTTQSFTNGNDCTAFFHGAGIVTAESGGTVNDWGIHMCDGYIVAGVGNPDTTIPSYYRVNDNVWHMITFTRNKTSGVFALYVDGDLQGSATGNTNTLNANANYNIGSVRPDGAKWQGYLDDLGVWSAVFQVTEIQRLYDHMSSKYAGAFASRVMDAGYTTASWNNFSWKTTLPFGKELPSYSGGIQNESTNDYAGLANSTLMNNIFALWHLNETATGTISDDSGNGKNGTISTNTGMGQVGRFGKAINPWNSSGIILGAASNYNFGSSSLTFSAWLKTQQTGGRIFSTQIWQYNGVLFETSDGNIKFDVGCADGPEANCISVRTSGSKFNDGAWHHAAVVWDRSTNKLRIYVDGFQQPITIVGSHCGSVSSKELNTSSCTSVNANASEAGAIGARSDGSWVFYGLLDEMAIWKRALAASEVLTLYRRGANRLSFQLRTCTNATCSGNAFYGPDGTGRTFFSEIHNNTSPLAGTGSVKPGLPLINIADFGYSLPSRRYLQYRVFIESDDSTKLCSGTTVCSPELQSLTIGDDHYPTTNPPISYTVSIPYYTLASFSESVTCAAGVKYQLSRDNSTWYYHNGTTWVTSDGTLAKSSAASAINTNASTFATVVGRTNLYVKALLPSDGTQSCAINSITVTGNSTY